MGGIAKQSYQYEVTLRDISTGEELMKFSVGTSMKTHHS